MEFYFISDGFFSITGLKWDKEQLENKYSCNTLGESDVKFINVDLHLSWVDGVYEYLKNKIIRQNTEEMLDL